MTDPEAPVRRHRWPAWLLAVWCLIPALPASGEAAALADTPDASAAPGTDSELNRVAERYEAEISQLQTERGVYDPFLGENLASLGRIYQELGKYDEAVTTLERAMQIRRVNEGLQSMSQVTILEQILQNNILDSNWEQVDRNYQQLLWLYRRNFSVTDPARLAMIIRAGRWKIQAFRYQLFGDKSARGLGEAEQLFSESIRLLKKVEGQTDPEMLKLLYGHALVNYQLLANTLNRPLSDFEGQGGVLERTTPVTTYRQVCSMVRMSDGSVERMCFLEPVTVYQENPNARILNAGDAKNQVLRQYMLDIRNDLQHMIHIYEQSEEDLSPLSSLFQLDDWSSNGRRGEYDEQDKYNQARDFMTKLGLKSSDIDQFFGSSPPPADASGNGPEPEEAPAGPAAEPEPGTPPADAE